MNCKFISFELFRIVITKYHLRIFMFCDNYSYPNYNIYFEVSECSASECLVNWLRRHSILLFKTQLNVLFEISLYISIHKNCNQQINRKLWHKNMQWLLISICIKYVVCEWTVYRQFHRPLHWNSVERSMTVRIVSLCLPGISTFIFQTSLTFNSIDVNGKERIY